MLQAIPTRLRRDLGVDAVEEVTFVQRTPVAYTYRDAIRFTNGWEILLQELGEGQRAKVLHLSSAEAPESLWEKQPELQAGLRPERAPHFGRAYGTRRGAGPWC